MFPPIVFYIFLIYSLKYYFNLRTYLKNPDGSLKVALNHAIISAQSQIFFFF